MRKAQAFDTVEDISEPKHLEDQLRLARQMEAAGRLAMGTTHDLNNLLTIVLGYSDLLLDRLSPADGMRPPLEEIKKAAERSASLTRQLLAICGKRLLPPFALVDTERMIPPANVPVDEPSLGFETIFLVESDEAVRYLTKRLLESRGYDVLEARGPVEALEVGEGYDRYISLLLTEETMPQMSGAELAKHLALLHPETKVLYMSGYAFGAPARHGLLETGTVFVEKPFTADALARKLREVLDDVEAPKT